MKLPSLLSVFRNAVMSPSFSHIELVETLDGLMIQAFHHSTDASGFGFAAGLTYEEWLDWMVG